MAAPGTPNTTSVPSLSITRTTASITFILGMAGVSPCSGGGACRRADRVLGEVLDEREEGGVVAVCEAARPQGLQHLARGRGGGQGDAVLARRGQRDAEVLVVQVDPEAGLEVVLEEVATADLHHPVGREAAREHLD